MKSNYYENNFEIKILRDYLRISTDHPNVDYGPCVEFLKKQAEILNLPVAVYYPKKRSKPVVVITWEGLNPKLPSIMFNSHMDVPPVFEHKWNYPPFGAEMDTKGRIYGCGIQDSKALGMQYLAAIRILKNEGFQGERTAHISFMPDEEVGGIEGMKTFVKTNAFRNLKIGFALDRGTATHGHRIPVYYGERFLYEVTFKIRGSTGDASSMPKNTAGEKFQLLLKKLMDLRQENVDKFCSNPKMDIGNITSVNLTKTKTLAFINNLPQMIEATFDIRLAISAIPQRFGSQLKQYVEEIGGGIEMQIADEDFMLGVTILNDTNLYWVAFKNALTELSVNFELQMFSGSTDMRFLRDESVKIPAINFSPMPETPRLANNHDEYLHADTYLKGINIYVAIMRALLNVGVGA